MKNFKKETIVQEILESTTCDKCGVIIEESSLEDESIHISHSFGYGSKQDGVKISFDLCEKCFMIMIRNIKYIAEEKY